MRWIFVFLLFASCRSQAPNLPAPEIDASQHSVTAAHVAEPVEEPAPAPPEIVLAEAPRVDLRANHERFYLYRDGLVVNFATDDVLKFNNAYNEPLGGVVELDGRKGKVIKRSSFDLQLPMEGSQAATARVFMHGVAKGQRLQLNVNGKRVNVQEVPAEWTQLVFDIPEGLLKKGENTFRFALRSTGTVSGNKTYGVFAAVELAGAAAGAAAEWPPATIQTEGGLGVYPRMDWLGEVPPNAFLSVDSDDVEVVALRNGQALPLRRDGKLYNLSDFGNQLITLSLRSKSTIKNPFIGVVEKVTRQRPKTYDNAILLVVDAMRSDRLKLYGDSRIDTPNFDKAAQSGVVFLRNQAASPSSPPSHSSIQTGMIPRVHGVTGDKGKLNPNTPLISNQAKAAGLATAYVGNNSFGMNRLRAAGEWDEFHQPVSEGEGIDCTAVVKGVLKFANASKTAGKRFFISALPFETHAPYRFHEGITEKYHSGEFRPPVGKNADGYLLVDIMAGRKQMNDQQWKQLEALYDGEVEHMDTCFGQLIEGLTAAGLLEDTAIVLTSDHGEGMNEHGRLGHAYGHYGELANVPFVVFTPGWTEDGPVRVESPTNVLDVAPTILRLLGIQPDEKIQGMDALALASRDEWVSRVVSSEYGRSYSLRSRDWRYIVNYDGTEEIYHVSEDPLEQKNLLDESPIGLRYLRSMAGFFLAHRSEWHAAKHGDWNNVRSTQP